MPQNDDERAKGQPLKRITADTVVSELELLNQITGYEEDTSIPSRTPAGTFAELEQSDEDTDFERRLALMIEEIDSLLSEFLPLGKYPNGLIPIADFKQLCKRLDKIVACTVT